MVSETTDPRELSQQLKHLEANGLLLAEEDGGRRACGARQLGGKRSPVRSEDRFACPSAKPCACV
jgi:hypothetical protein